MRVLSARLSAKGEVPVLIKPVPPKMDDISSLAWWVGMCGHVDCLAENGGRAWESGRGSPGMAGDAVQQHWRAKHGG
jgi:hypothetical protein